MTLFGITFLFPAGFLFLPFVIMVAYFLRDKQVADMILARIEGTNSWWHIRPLLAYRIVFWCAILLMTLLLAQPHQRSDIQDIQYEGIDVMIVLDVSESMQATDFDPSRIEGAKRVVSDFLSGSEGNRVGTILFSGQPFLFAPLTHDTHFLIEQTSSISTDTIAEEYLSQSGTAIGDAILLASKHIEDYGDPDRDAAIILVTDGEANQGVDPLIAAAYIADQGVAIYSVGLGDPVGTWQNVRSGRFVQQVFLKLDEATLKQVSSLTGGNYYRASDDASLEQIFDDLSQLTVSRIIEERITRYDRAFEPLLWPLLSVLLILLTLQMLYPRLRPW